MKTDNFPPGNFVFRSSESISQISKKDVKDITAPQMCTDDCV